MGRPSVVTATYRPNGTGETFRVRVEVPTSFPDVVDEARSQAVRGVVDLMREAIQAYTPAKGG